jgi:hypothetical protein
MPTRNGGYIILWIPASGLFYRGGDFFDGKSQPIGWDRSIRIFSAFSEAERERAATLARFPDATGELIILPIRKSKSHGLLE